MNDDELRAHLRSTLEPVSSPTPELARLRRLARRRRRRLQATAGGLGLLLVAGAAIGIAVAVTTSGGPDRVTVRPAATRSVASRLAIPCVPAPGSSNVRHVTLSVGQTLSLTACPPGATASMLAGGGLSAAGSFSYLAVRPGTSAVRVNFAMCAALPGTARPDCFGGLAEVNVEVNVGRPGATESAAKGVPPEPVACTGGRVNVLVGQQLDLEDCPAGLSSHIDDPSVLAPGDSASTFTALKPGTTNIELYVSPVCTPGTMCPKYVRDLGTLVVTVSPR